MTPSGPVRLEQVLFSVKSTMSTPKVFLSNPLRPHQLLPGTSLGASPQVKKVVSTPGRGTPKVVGLPVKASTPTARRVGGASVFSRVANSPLARDPKPSSTRATASQRLGTSHVSRNGEQTPKTPLGSRDPRSKAAPTRNTQLLVNADRMVRKVSSPAGNRLLGKSKSLLGSTPIRSPAPAARPRSPASGLRRLTDAHETPPPVGTKTTQPKEEQEQEEEEEEEESPLKLREELVGIGRQLGGLARRIDLCNSQDKENIDIGQTVSWNENNAANHSDELSR